MKKTFIKLFVSGVLFAAPVLLLAQPNPGSNAGGGAVGGNPIGGGAAPLGGGIALMLSLGAAYGTKKIYHFRCKEKRMG